MRDSKNPVKLRAEQRAAQLGKTLSTVYDDAGVSRGYLSVVPKTGYLYGPLWRVARELGWGVDELLNSQPKIGTVC
jgi:hypothetical protein